MISVCMASFNGQRWIENQVRSVLPQLRENDELIVVDDGSSDLTFDLITGLGDSRIRVVRNERNLGVLKSFQTALGMARGDILFLCDQDDVWYPDKVERILKAFDLHPEVTLVLSDACIVDAEGRMTAPSFFADRGGFFPGVIANVLKNKFLGCTMAVRREMRARFLPFPERIPMHDMWIGVINEIYGKTLYISEPLMAYRRHDGNLSPARRQSVLQMLHWRWRLVSSLAIRVVGLSLPRAR